VGRSFPEVLKSGLGFPTVRVEMEFLSPVHHGDSVVIGVAVQRLGRSSLEMSYEGSVDGRPVFQAKNVMVAVDLKSFRPTPIPPWLRERLESARA
jgi:4-hydroxybenzoyl-CoA thioesterase